MLRHFFSRDVHGTIVAASGVQSETFETCQERSTLTRKGERVAFLISDAFIPNTEEIRTGFSETSELEGTVVDFSDSGTASQAFAVVEVIRTQTVIIAVGKLRSLESPEHGKETRT